jgi:hypothetical protein
MTMRLVVIRTVVVIVPFFTLLQFKALTLLALVFNPVTCISVVDDVTQISVIPVSSSDAFLQWSEIACRVPMRTLPLLEALHVYVDFFIVFLQVGVS